MDDELAGLMDAARGEPDPERAAALLGEPGTVLARKSWRWPYGGWSP